MTEPVCIHCAQPFDPEDADECVFQGKRCSIDICPIYVTFDEWLFARGYAPRGSVAIAVGIIDEENVPKGVVPCCRTCQSGGNYRYVICDLDGKERNSGATCSSWKFGGKYERK